MNSWNFCHPRFSRSFIAALCFLVGATMAFGQRQLLDYRDKKGANRIEVEGIFNSGINSGFLPVRVTIRNATAEDKTWTVNFKYSMSSYGSASRTSSFSIKVDKQSELVQELFVPVPLVLGDSTYGYLVTSASAPGAGGSERQENWNYSTEWPGIVVSQKLGKTMPELTKEMRSRSSHSSQEFGGLFNPEHLPSDWRGYMGADVMMIDDEAWNAVQAGPRKAIREWVRMGGRLDIYSVDGGSPVEYGFEGSDLVKNGVHNFSLGSVRVKQWNGTQLNATNTVRDYQGIKNRAKSYAEDFDNANDWQLQKGFGEGEFNAILVFILLIAFGVMVGPINLFVFAKPGKRHKLFITTPIISVIASLAILALIFLQDGIGGEGRRVAFANLQSGEEKRIYLHQEQISRTGVLLSTAFDPSETAFVTPVRLSYSKWNRLMDQNNYFRGNFETKGTVESGDWFQSRSEQAQVLRAVRPTRSRVELRQPASEDGITPPKLFSSLEFKVKDFYYRDRNGNVWESTSSIIAPGNDIPLQKIENKNELDTWWRNQTESFGNSFRQEIRKLDERPGHFFCTTDDSKTSLIESLGSIRWKNDLIVMTGDVSEESAN